MRIVMAFFLLLIHHFLPAQQVQTITENLSVIRLSEKAFIHVGMLESATFGRVGCNGLVYIHNDEAVIMDTPPDTAQSRALLQWIEKSFPGIRVKAVLVNHFHGDCLAGLPVFHQKGIPSYANRLTVALAKKDSVPVPQHAFDKEHELTIGGARIISRFLGEAHSRDNIVTWIPSEKTLFGGCMIKALGATKGNLADANEKEWSQTVEKVKKAFGDAVIVVPGHGNAGTTELLDYTIRLFQEKPQP